MVYNTPWQSWSWTLMNRTSPFAWFIKLGWTLSPPLGAHLPLPLIHMPKPSLALAPPKIICFLPTHRSECLSPILKYHFLLGARLFPPEFIISSTSSPLQGTIPRPILSPAPFLPQGTIFEPIFTLRPHLLLGPIFSQNPFSPAIIHPRGHIFSQALSFPQAHLFPKDRLIPEPISSLSPPSP